MSRPSGDDKSHGEGAANSHWASIILSVAVLRYADLERSAFVLEGYRLSAIGYRL